MTGLSTKALSPSKGKQNRTLTKLTGPLYISDEKMNKGRSKVIKHRGKMPTVGELKILIGKEKKTKRENGMFAM